MARPDPDALSILLEQALALPAESRGRFLDDACKGDPALRDELDDLLVAHQAATGYFERLTDQIVRPGLLALADEDADEIAPGHTVAHYRIVEELGAGGMGVVFKALDQRLGRFVALKFLPQHLSADASAKARFLTEAQSASALDHPNIAVVHEIGETQSGRLFIVMTCYEGETLQRRNENGRLPLREALNVAQQIASALGAAHAKGIIHRDVKPSNILITTDGTVKLLDFGIAKLGHVKHTGKEAALGTLAYMSPEQVEGNIIDHRTDLWSLGVVLYEMLTGLRPFAADDDKPLSDAICHDECDRADRLNPDIPASVVRILDRCLAKGPDGRYGQAEDMRSDLEAVAGRGSLGSRPASVRRRLVHYGSAMVVLASVVAATLYVRRAPEEQAVHGVARPDRNRLAVLPVASSGSDPSETYLADAMTAELIAQFSKMPALRVIARSSVMRYKDARKSAVEIGRELAVGTVLEGHLDDNGDGMQITLRLVDTRSQQRLWTASYPANVGELQVLLHEITQGVVDALRVHLPPGVRFSMAGTSNPEAYVLYLKGRHFLDKGSPDSVTQARDYFQQALDLDPAFARAWSGLGDAYGALGVVSSLSAADAYPRTKAAAERALQLDPDLPEAHVSLGTALSYYYWDFEAAARHFRRAIELNPSYADARRFYAEYLRYEARFDEALVEARQAEALDPLSPGHEIEEGITLYLARRYGEAADRFERLLRANPKFTYAHFFLALVYVQQHKYESALAALEQVGAGQRPADVETLRAYIYAVTGRSAEAREGLEKLKALSPGQPSLWHLAMVHLALGGHDRALELLEQAYRDRAWELRLLRVEPLFDPLRSNPQFVALVDKVR
jgi:TolB-like protein/tetratricopeptide (TPR) repeat protein